MRGLSTDDTTEAHHGVKLARQRQAARRHRDLEGARDAHDRDVLVPDAVPSQTVERPLEEALRDEVVEPAHHEGDPEPLSVQVACNDAHRHVFTPVGILTVQGS